MTLNDSFKTHLLFRPIAFLSLVVLLSAHCASQRAPSGGPEDKTPPTILNVVPERNATLVPRNQVVAFSFSKPMEHKTFERTVFITPNPGDRVKFDWSGETFKVEFLDSLRVNRTYVITLGTDIRDRRGNSLTSSYTLAFSTGEALSDGKIAGSLYGTERKQGVLLWAYILDEERVPDPAHAPGDYIVQSDASGKFQFTNLSEGTYRVFAIEDKDNNRFFEKGLDGLGMTFSDITLTSDSVSVSGVDFRLAVTDTTGPALLSASASDRLHLRLQFDEELQVESVRRTKNYAIRPAGDKAANALRIGLAYTNALNRNEIVLRTEPQSGGASYEVVVDSLVDKSGNSVDPTFNKAAFTGSALPDTSRIKLLRHTPADSAHAVSLNVHPQLFFNNELDSTSLASGIVITDTTDTRIAGELQLSSPSVVTFVPRRAWRTRTDYLVRVLLDSLVSASGVSGDTTASFVFTTLNEDTLASVSGSIFDPDSTASGPIKLTLTQTTDNKVFYEVWLEEPGPYEFARILPGTYQLEGFRDSDLNGAYSFGSAVPFIPAERFFVYSSQIKVRSRWPNEGNDVTLPQGWSP